MDRDMVNCLHYLYQWQQITRAQLDERDPKKRLFWCAGDTNRPLTNREIVREDGTTGDLKLDPGVYDLIDMIEEQLRSMPKPDYAFGYPFSAAIRPQGSLERIQGTLMKIITLHPLIIVVEGFYASASEIRRTWDTSPCDGTGN